MGVNVSGFNSGPNSSNQPSTPTALTTAQMNAGAVGVVGVTASGSQVGPGGSVITSLKQRPKLVCGRGQIGGANTDSGGTNTTTMTKIAIKPVLPFSISNPRIILTHFGVAGAATDEYLPSPSGTLTATASINANSVFRQLTWNGQVSCALNPGGIAVSDAGPVDIAASAAWNVLYFISTASGNKWARGEQIFTGLGDACNEAVGGADLTLGGAITNTNGAGYAFTGVVGLTSAPQLAIAGLGDSIMWGQGDDPTGLLAPGNTTGNGQGYWGWLGRACYNSATPFLVLARAGDQASFNQPPYSYRKNIIGILPSGPIVDWVIVNLGTNDATNGRTYAQLKADLTALIADYQRRGVNVAICSITPKTTSTDSWATVANQSFASGHGLTDGPNLVNIDLRSGNWYGANAFFDLAANIESSPGSCLWAASFTADGLHPNQTAHIALSTLAQTFIGTLQTI